MSGNELFLIGAYRVQASDVIALVALVVSILSAIAAIRSSIAASRTNHRAEEKERARSRIRVEIAVVNDDDEGPGPQRHLKIFLSPPEDGTICELNRFQSVTPAIAVELRYAGEQVRAKGPVELRPALVINSRTQINMTVHLLVFAGPTIFRFSGVRQDASRSAVEVEVPVPPFER
jgi:hypothetical protein